MSEPVTPAQVVQAVAAGVSRLIGGRLPAAEKEAQLDQLAALYAERTEVRHPFAPLGDEPLRTRADLRRHFADGPGRAVGAESFAPVGRVHETPDPEVVIFEFAYVGSVGGRPVEIPCIFVTRVRDGVIVESRDYGDHLGLARAFGGLGRLATALAAEAGRPDTDAVAGRPDTDVEAGYPETEAEAGRPDTDVEAGRPDTETG